ncbi:MAG: DUF551 domain-containing protein [Immundisolibacteraceae bacterium]|nr:DUF551 domain-containing protein [Immundisolibacteraceae bacterium]
MRNPTQTEYDNRDKSMTHYAIGTWDKISWHKKGKASDWMPDNAKVIPDMEPLLNGWIDVDVRLPEDATSVIASCDDDVCECLVDAPGDGTFEFTAACSGLKFNATHWQPLPPPAYKEPT